MTMRRFLIRVVQVFALAIIGTGLLVDTSFALSKEGFQDYCENTLGGVFGEYKYGLHKGDVYCVLPTTDNKVIRCSSRDEGGPISSCSQRVCPRGRACERTPYDISQIRDGDTPKGKGRKGTTTMTGPILDRSRNPGAPTLGAPVNGTLNGGAPSKTAPIVGAVN